MQLIIDVETGKEMYFLDILKSLDFIKFKDISDTKLQFLLELNESVETLNLIKQNKSKARPLVELLNEI
jgi:hypothetical protein